MTSPTSTHSTDPGVSCRMLQALLDGYRGTTTFIYIAAKPSLPDLLADGPQSSDTFCESWSSSARRTHERAAGPNSRGVVPSSLSSWPSSRHGGKGRLDFLYSYAAATPARRHVGWAAGSPLAVGARARTLCGIGSRLLWNHTI